MSRIVFVALVAGRICAVTACAAPLNVAEDRDASVLPEAGSRFNPATPNDGAFDANDEPVSLGDPTD